MITRRQLLINGTGFISGLCITSPIAKIINHGDQSKSADSNRKKKLTHEIWRDMLVHKAVGHSLPPGHWVAGHGWLHRRSLARKFINDYYNRHQLLPRGKHDLASMPAMMSPWVVDFDTLLSSIELDLTHGDISDYPKPLRDNIVGALQMR